MTPTERVITFRPDDDLLEGMEVVRERFGTPFSEQIRRALRAWLLKQLPNEDIVLPRLSARAAVRARRNSDVQKTGNTAKKK